MCLFSMGVMAQKTFYDMERLTVNENVTSIITASEPIRMVDISTDSPEELQAKVKEWIEEFEENEEIKKLEED